MKRIKTRNAMLICLLAVITLCTLVIGCSKESAPKASPNDGPNSIKDGGIYKIINKATKRPLNMQLSGMVDGAQVWQYGDTGGFDELWRVKKQGDYYTLQSLLTPRNISICKDSKDTGAIIEVRKPDEKQSSSQLWTLKEYNGSIQIISSLSDYTLGLTENSKKSSILPQMLTFTKDEWQLWDFKEVSLTKDLPYLLPVEGSLFHSSCPQIIKYGDTYYMFIMAPHISIKTSKDLINWTIAGTVFGDKDPSWMNSEVPGYGIWAPSVYKIKDKYYLYYCISTSGSQNSAIGMAVNNTLDMSSPDYHWEDKGVVIRSHTGDDYNCIDPNISIDENGDVFLTFGSYWNGIYQRSIDPDTGLLLKENSKLYHIARRYANNGAIEAPYIIKRGEYYYLFTAFNPMNNTYHNRVGRSKSIHGPYLDREGKSMLEGGGTPVTQGLSELLMPGHASVFQDEDGKYYFVSEYFRKASASILLIGTIHWDKEGWPVTALTPDAVKLLAK